MRKKLSDLLDDCIAAATAYGYNKAKAKKGEVNAGDCYEILQKKRAEIEQLFSSPDVIEHYRWFIDRLLSAKRSDVE